MTEENRSPEPERIPGNPKKPQTIEELQADVDKRQATSGRVKLPDGTLSDLIIPEGSIEYRYGTIPGWLYNKLLLRGAVRHGFDKSLIGKEALQLFVDTCYNFVGDNMDTAFGLLYPYAAGLEEDKGTEFRCYLSAGLHREVMERKEQLKYSYSQIMIIAASLFVNNGTINNRYRKFINETIAAYRCTEEQIEDAIYSRWKSHSRSTRLELSLSAGKLITDRKLA